MAVQLLWKFKSEVYLILVAEASVSFTLET